MKFQNFKTLNPQKKLCYEQKLDIVYIKVTILINQHQFLYLLCMQHDQN